MERNTQHIPGELSSPGTGAGPSDQLLTMDYRHPSHRWVPSWAWRTLALAIGASILYRLGAWVWEQLSG